MDLEPVRIWIYTVVGLNRRDVWSSFADFSAFWCQFFIWSWGEHLIGTLWHQSPHPQHRHLVLAHDQRRTRDRRERGLECERRPNFCSSEGTKHEEMSHLARPRFWLSFMNRMSQKALEGGYRTSSMRGVHTFLICHHWSYGSRMAPSWMCRFQPLRNVCVKSAPLIRGRQFGLAGATELLLGWF